MDGALVWMDLEMTGLDPTTDVIVEIATLVTDAELNIVAEGPDLVVHVDDDALGGMGDVVKNMHAKSGLTDAIRASTVTLEDAGAATLAFIKEHVPQRADAPRCAAIQHRHRPPLPRRLPARDRGVSALPQRRRVHRQRTGQPLVPAAYAKRPNKTGNHRALGDIVDSVNELRYYREAVFLPRT